MLNVVEVECEMGELQQTLPTDASTCMSNLTGTLLSNGEIDSNISNIVVYFYALSVNTSSSRRGSIAQQPGSREDVLCLCILGYALQNADNNNHSNNRV